VEVIVNEAFKPTEHTLKREALFICNPTGFSAYECTEPPTDHELSLMRMERVVFKPVKLYPPVCPINGAEGGDDPYWVRLPHRSDGTRLKLS
jgi:hypothetical protein